jgi:hypothetical protein
VCDRGARVLDAADLMGSADPRVALPWTPPAGANVGQPDQPKADSFFGAVAPADLHSQVASSEPGQSLTVRA